MRHLLVLGIILSLPLALPVALGASRADESVSIATVTPSSGPAGTLVSFTLAGTEAAGTRQCLTSSAYRLEFLAPDGVLGATGGATVVAPPGAEVGESAIRLVCYVPDATGRRVIHGLCGRFTLTAAGGAAPAPGAASVPCPAAPRLVLGQSVIAVERLLSEAFNPLLSARLAS